MGSGPPHTLTEVHIMSTYCVPGAIAGVLVQRVSTACWRQPLSAGCKARVWPSRFFGFCAGVQPILVDFSGQNQGTRSAARWAASPLVRILITNPSQVS